MAPGDGVEFGETGVQFLQQFTRREPRADRGEVGEVGEEHGSVLMHRGADAAVAFQLLRHPLGQDVAQEGVRLLFFLRQVALAGQELFLKEDQADEGELPFHEGGKVLEDVDLGGVEGPRTAVQEAEGANGVGISGGEEGHAGIEAHSQVSGDHGVGGEARIAGRVRDDQGFSLQNGVAAERFPA